MPRNNPALRKCTRCGAGHYSQVYVRCFRCRDISEAAREYGRQYNRERYADLKAAGLCFQCKNPAVRGLTICQTHRVAQTLGDRRRRQERAKKGRCVKCAGPNESSLKTCTKCRTKMRIRDLKAREHWCPCGLERKWDERQCERCQKLGASYVRSRLVDVLKAIVTHPGVDVYRVAEIVELSVRGVIRHCRVLEGRGLIRRDVGGGPFNRTTYWPMAGAKELA